MSATEYPTFVLRPPSSRALSTRVRAAGKFETLVLAAGICLPVPLLAATGLSVPLPNVVERIAAALVPWAEPVAVDAAELEGSSGTIVLSRADLVAAAPTSSTAPAEATEGGAPQKTVRKASLLPLTPGARPAPTPSRQPVATDSRPAAAPTPQPASVPTPTASAEPERAADAPATRPTAAEPAPTAPGAQAPAPRPASDPAPTQEAPAPATAAPTQTTTTSTPLQETVDTVTGVVADPVGTVEETIADPIGAIEETLPVLEPVTKPLKPLLPGLGK